MLKIGPAGSASTGRKWDNKDKSGIAQIFISHGDLIHSLQFQFVEDGNLVLSDKHGGEADGSTHPPKFSLIQLNYPSELITRISGYSGKRYDWEDSFPFNDEDDYYWFSGVTSIIFTTDNATYGPFGCPAKSDVAFDYQIGGRNMVCGFYGTADNYLNSIGVYMKPMPTLSNVNNLTEKVMSKMKRFSFALRALNNYPL